MEKNPKYAPFLQRYWDDSALYGMAACFVINNGYNLVRAMTKEEFDKAVSVERNFLGTKGVNELFAAAKDIVASVSPLMLVVLVGNECYPLTYLQEVYGSRVSRGEAVCPNCGGSIFKDTENGSIICVGCECRIPLQEMDTLRQRVGFHTARPKSDWVDEDSLAQQAFHGMLQFIEERQDDLRFDAVLYRETLRKKWTAYCIGSGVNLNTPVYEGDIDEVWGKLSEVCDGHSLPDCWATPELFKEDLSKALKIMEEE